MNEYRFLVNKKLGNSNSIVKGFSYFWCDHVAVILEFFDRDFSPCRAQSLNSHLLPQLSDHDAFDLRWFIKSAMSAESNPAIFRPESSNSFGKQPATRF